MTGSNADGYYATYTFRRQDDALMDMFCPRIPTQTIPSAFDLLKDQSGQFLSLVEYTELTYIM